MEYGGPVEIRINTTESLTENPNTFLDYRLNVTISGPSRTIMVPGYFAADGNASETSATSGSVWIAKFTPVETGNHQYTISFRTGNDIAVNPAQNGSAYQFDGDTGSFSVSNSSKPDSNFNSKGKLEYRNENWASFTNGEYYFEVGADSPETFLEYAEFDNTPSSRTYPAHVANWNNGDLSWKNGQGKGIVGAVNFLADQGMNVQYFLTMSVDGDGDDAFPFTSKTAITNYDVSKLAQWQLVMEYMMSKGVGVEMVLLETENLNFFETRSGQSRNSFSDGRKLYYREMVARFGHLNAIIYNVGEEANWSSSTDIYTAAQIEEAAAYIQDLSGYNNLISVHNGPTGVDGIFGELLALSGPSSLTAISFQGTFSSTTDGHNKIRNWIDESQQSDDNWVVRYSEPYSQGNNPNVETWTENALWAGLTAGAAAVHYYAGGGDDLTVQDYRVFEDYFGRMKIAKDFFLNNNIPFWNMSNDDGDTSTGYLLSDNNTHFVGFLANGGSANVTLPGGSNYDLYWYNPRNGGSLVPSSNSFSGGTVSTGNPPNNTGSSWVYYFVKNDPANPINATGINLDPATATISIGQNTQLTASVLPANATNKNVNFQSSNSSVATVSNQGLVIGVAEGQATITVTTEDGSFTDTTVITVAGGSSSCNGIELEEQNGLLVVEAENLSDLGNWRVESATAGFSGSAYIEWGQGNNFNTPGVGTISTTIRINNPGRYRFQWRSKVGEGNNATEENDSWLRFPDASSFYGQQGNSIVYPKGSGLSPTPEGAGADGWFKVYSSGTTNWTWSTRTSDNDPHDIYVEFDSPGIYTMEISARSQFHFIDRIVLSQASVSNPTDLALAETFCTGSNEPVSVTGVTLSPESITLDPGQTQQLSFSVLPGNASNQSVSFSSSNNNIATVSNQGLVTAVSSGQVTITVTTQEGGFTDTTTVVVENQNSTVAVTGVNMSPASSTLTPGGNVQLNTTVSPSNATNKGVSFQSSNNNIATVNNQGLVTAVAEGQATITVSTDDGNFTDTTSISVVEDTGDCSGAELEEKNNLLVIEAENLNNLGNWRVETGTAGFSGSAYIVWEQGNNFNNPGVGTISTTIRINNPGRYRFQWRSKVGEGNSATDENDSWLRFPDASDFYGQRGNSIVYPKGSGQTPNPEGSGRDGWFKVYSSGTTNWTWSTRTSDNDPHDIYVEFDTPGLYTMEISARSQFHFLDRIVLSQNISDPTNLNLDETFCDGNNEPIAVTGVNMTPGSTTLNVGQTEQLSVNVLPGNAANQNVSFSSSNNAIATVNNSGFVTAVAAGEATITVTTQDGGFTDTTQIIVQEENSTVMVTGVNLTPSNVGLSPGQTQQLSASVLPSNATDKEVSYSSSNTSVATVSNTGLVTGVSEGQATITVTTSDGGFTDTSNITVQEENSPIAVTAINLTPESTTLEREQTVQLITEVLPADATNKAVTYVSSNEAVATVDAEGLVTAVDLGEVTITAFTEDGNLSDSMTIQVVNSIENLDDKVIIAPNPINRGETFTLSGVPANDYVLKIYDLAGRLIYLDNNVEINGTYSLEVPNADSGLHVLILESISSELVSKILFR